MTTIGKANLAPPAFEQQQAGHECCMCGDYGLSCELFQCSLCLFRSQHRYCSNLYPKAESYTLCNWCLHDSDKPPPHNSSNSSSSCKNSSGDDDSTTSNKHQGKPLRGGLQIKKLPVRSPEGSPSPSPSPRKRIITNGRLEEIRRTKSEEIAKNNKNNGNGNGNGTTTTTTTTKQQVFKNKVRRYKLLDEVSS